MILTNCAACAAPLAHTAPRCVRCHTRYCDSKCQHDHWRRGHKQMCKKIHRGGNAEQYNADKKYKEAVAVAVEACAEDTKGQTCYICTQALHWETKEGLVRMCSCRGTAGFAHVSCLAEQAKILVEEAEEKNMGDLVKYERFERFYQCGLCKQRHHGVVGCALGWACWKTYCGRPQPNLAPPAGDWVPDAAITMLGNGLSEGRRHDESIAVFKGHLASSRARGRPLWPNLDSIEVNLANSYQRAHKHEVDDGLALRRRLYDRRVTLFGLHHAETLSEATCLASMLIGAGLHIEARSLLRTHIPDISILNGYRGPHVEEVAKFNAKVQLLYGGTFLLDEDASLKEIREALPLFESAHEWYQRYMGPDHPDARTAKLNLETARERIEEEESFW